MRITITVVCVGIKHTLNPTSLYLEVLQHQELLRGMVFLLSFSRFWPKFWCWIPCVLKGRNRCKKLIFWSIMKVEVFQSFLNYLIDSLGVI